MTTDGYVTDGYKIDFHFDGYYSLTEQFGIGPKPVYTNQLNVKLTEEDMKSLAEINKEFFEDEASNSMLGRILIRKGISFYKKLKI